MWHKKCQSRWLKDLASPEKEVRKTTFWPHTNLATLLEKNYSITQIWHSYKQLKKRTGGNLMGLIKYQYLPHM